MYPAPIVGLVAILITTATVIGIYGPDWFGRGQPTTHMHNVYVDNVMGSNERGDGSIANPWQTVQFGIDTVSNYYWTPPTEHDQYTVHHPPGTRTENVTMRAWVGTMCDGPSRQCQCICCNYTVDDAVWYTNGPGQGAFVLIVNEFFNDSIALGCKGGLNFNMPADAVGQHIVFHNGVIIASETSYTSNAKMGLNIQAFDSPYHTKPFVNGSSFKLYGTTSQLFLGATFHTNGHTTIDLEGVVNPPAKPGAPAVTFDIFCDQSRNFQMTVGSVGWSTSTFNVAGKCAPFLGGPYPGPSHLNVNPADGNTFPGVDWTNSISYSPPSGHAWTNPGSLASALNDTQRSAGNKFTPVFSLAGITSGSIKSGLCTYTLDGNEVKITFIGTVNSGGLSINGTTWTLTITNPVTVSPNIQVIAEPIVGQSVSGWANIKRVPTAGDTIVTSITSVTSSFVMTTPNTILSAGTPINVVYYYYLV